MRLSCGVMCILLLVALGGCHSSAAPSTQYEVAFFSCRPDGPTPYPCSNLRLIAATPLHVYRDPDDTKFTRFHLDKIDILKGPTELATGSFCGGSSLPFLVYQEATESIICAPGFNPEVVLTQHSLDDAYGKIQNATKTQTDLDADYRRAAEVCAFLGTPGKPVRIPLVPLYAKIVDGGNTQDVAVNHSMLVFLLDLDDVWTDLRRLYNDQSHKKAVILVCKTIEQMAKAHREKWPMYKWNEKQQRVIDWCHSIAATD